MDLVTALKATSNLRKDAIVSAIKELNLQEGSVGLDAACGIGDITQLLAQQIGNTGHVTGADLSTEVLDYAKQEIQNSSLKDRISFVQEDINKLSFDDNSFDWMMSVDTLWPGPQEIGCPCEDPLPIINDLKRVIKPGGTVALLFWSSQKLFSGYPILEAKLNSLSTASVPMNENSNPSKHILRAKEWLMQSGYEDIKVKTFTADFASPLSDTDKKGIMGTLGMLYNDSVKGEIEDKYWEQYKNLTNPDTKDYIFDQDGYCGFLTYTMFYAKVAK